MKSANHGHSRKYVINQDWSKSFDFKGSVPQKVAMVPYYRITQLAMTVYFLRMYQTKYIKLEFVT